MIMGYNVELEDSVTDKYVTSTRLRRPQETIVDVKKSFPQPDNLGPQDSN